MKKQLITISLILCLSTTIPTGAYGQGNGSDQNNPTTTEIQTAGSIYKRPSNQNPEGQGNVDSENAINFLTSVGTLLNSIFDALGL